MDRPQSLWFTADGKSYYLIPDDVELPAGSLNLRTLSGRAQDVDPEQAEVWRASEDQVTGHVRAQMEHGLERVKSALAGAFAEVGVAWRQAWTDPFRDRTGEDDANPDASPEASAEASPKTGAEVDVPLTEAGAESPEADAEAPGQAASTGADAEAPGEAASSGPAPSPAAQAGAGAERLERGAAWITDMAEKLAQTMRARAAELRQEAEGSGAAARAHLHLVPDEGPDDRAE
ncbi:hypothetical protein [Haliangium sp.]|uniref:hypothetical protein n=1 Tax=Haliangium sp. TaxID=2663208 RepID=UPI003D0A1A5C